VYEFIPGIRKHETKIVMIVLIFVFLLVMWDRVGIFYLQVLVWGMEFYKIEFIMKIFFIFSTTYVNILESIRIFVME